MGYYYKLRSEQEVFIAAENFPAIEEACEKEMQQIASEYTKGSAIEEYAAGNTTALEAVRNLYGWDLTRDTAGNGVALWHEESKDLKEEFLNILAPWVREGSYLEVQGEDSNDWWRWVFVRGEVMRSKPEIIWKSLEELQSELAAKKAEEARWQEWRSKARKLVFKNYEEMKSFKGNIPAGTPYETDTEGDSYIVYID